MHATRTQSYLGTGTVVPRHCVLVLDLLVDELSSVTSVSATDAEANSDVFVCAEVTLKCLVNVLASPDNCERLADTHERVLCSLVSIYGRALMSLGDVHAVASGFKVGSPGRYGDHTQACTSIHAPPTLACIAHALLF